MKVLALMMICGLAGCAVGPTLEQLEKQAMFTGDWSEVERRERMLVRRNLRAGIQCPPGTIGYCEVRLSDRRCTCVSSRALSVMLSR